MNKTENHRRIISMDGKIRWILAFSVIAFTLFLLVLLQQKNKQDSSRLLIDHTNLVIRQIDTIGLVFAEAEAATRSYLIVRDKGWQQQVTVLHPLITASISRLLELTKHNATQQINVLKLQEWCLRKQQFQKKLLSQQFITEETAQMIRPNGEGPVISRTVKQLLRKLRDVEEALLAERMALNENSYKSSIYTAFAGGVFAILLVLAILSRLNLDIHLRKKAEVELASNEEKYRKLIENAGVVMYTTDAKGNISFANNRIAELTGYTVDELTGKHFSVLLEPEWTEKVVAFYMDQYEKFIPASYLELQIKTKSGECKWVEQTAQLLIDEEEIQGFQCMVKDITEQKQVQQELDESEARRKENEYRLNAILDNTNTLIFIKDLDFRYLVVNRRFKEVFELTDEMVLNKKDHDFNPKALADHYLEIDKQVIATGKAVQIEEALDTPEGKRNFLVAKFPLFDDNQQLFGISGIATDITESVENRQQLMVALKKAETAQQIQEQFLANMSHEIRTPMNGIQGMTRLLMETSLSEEQKRFTNIINRSLNNLVVIVNNVLDYSNLKAGKLTLDSFAFDVAETMEELKKHFEHALGNKKLTFTIRLQEGTPRFVKGDAFRLKQVLTNLIGNAIKFTNEGSIELVIRVKEQDENISCLSFALRDTGIGIAKDKLETIFESFAQGDKKIASGYGGAGLGLTISKGLIELQGGQIAVISEQGNGATFLFDIPFGRAHSRDVVASQVDFASKLSGKRILVVEDNIVNQRLIDFVLKKMNITADIADNGQLAIEKCQKNPPYDLIIMDLQMPVMDGYETTIYLREKMGLKTPIIAMTATALKEDQERSARVGMNDFMVKPFDFNDLYARMIRLLFHVTIHRELIETEAENPEKGYDLALLEELEDPNYVLEVLGYFLEQAPADIKELTVLVLENNRDALAKKAHKLKGASGMLKAEKLQSLLAGVELGAKKDKTMEELAADVTEIQKLFSELEKALQKEVAELKKQVGKGS
ncbi:MAG TPA: PAS domain S-box protein [Sediminibacterium sp.]